MNVTCTQCQMKIGIEDSKLPSTPFSIKCPRCRETITVNPPPKEEPKLESRGRPQVPAEMKGNQDAMKWGEGASQACQAAWNRAGSQSQSGDRDMQSQQSQGQQKIHGESTGRTS